MYRSGERVRVIGLEEKPTSGEKPGPDPGWIDLDRIKLSVNPRCEWPQILAEAWRLRRDYFWMESMGGVAWSAMFDRYARLLDRIATRSEFADLLGELCCELGTSHSYLKGGDYALPNPVKQGYLAAWPELVEGTYRVSEVAHEDR